MLEESLRLALQRDAVLDTQRIYQTIWVSRVGASPEDRLRAHEEGAAHARRYGYHSDLVPFRETIESLNAGDWDRSLAAASELGDSIWSASPRLLEAFIRVARDGPEAGLPLLDEPRRRLLAAGDAQWRGASSFSAQVMLVAGDLRSCLTHAEPVAELIELGRRAPATNGVAVCAIVAAAWLGDDVAWRRWIDVATTEPRSQLDWGMTSARREFARAERALPENVAEALERYAHAADVWERERFQPLAATLIRLRRAEAFVREGDRDAASAEIAKVLPYWRKAKASWYLGRLREWAAERGISFPD